LLVGSPTSHKSYNCNIRGSRYTSILKECEHGPELNNDYMIDVFFMHIL
jgi:hypothetical protein